MIFISRPVKCPVCEKTFIREDEEFVVHNKRYYHKKCFTEKFPNQEEKDELTNYIKKLLNIERLSPLINKQIKDYLSKEYNFTYSGIKKTLEYFYIIKNNDIRKARGIGIVPYAYEEAKAYYYNLYVSRENIKSAVIKNEKKAISVNYRKENAIKKRRGIL